MELAYSNDPPDILNRTARDFFVGALTPITLREKVLELGPNTLDEALAAVQRYESNQKVLNKGSARVLSSTSGDQENGVKSQALLDTVAEATIISEDLYSRSKTHLNKLEPTQKPVLGANNMPLDVVGKTEVTIQLGGIRAQHKVLVCRGLVQQVLIGIDFLTAHKCIINFDTNTVYSKGEPNKIVFGCLDKVYRITVAATVTSPNMVATYLVTSRE